MPGYVYVLTNPLMPGIVKIGFTSRRDIGARMRELFQTGVPAEFELAMAYECEGALEVEKQFHRLLVGSRTHPRREFYNVEVPEVLRPFLDRFGREIDVDGYTDDDGSRPLTEGASTRKPHFDFCRMGIPLRGILRCEATGDEVEVVAPKKVEFDGERMSISAATTKIEKWPPGRNWTYEGQSLDDIRVDRLASGAWYEIDCADYEDIAEGLPEEPPDLTDEDSGLD